MVTLLRMDTPVRSGGEAGLRPLEDLTLALLTAYNPVNSGLSESMSEE